MYSSLSSSYTFGSRVQRLFQGPKSVRQHHDISPRASEVLNQSRSHVSVFDLPSFPSEKEALELLETQVFYIGYTQNHVDPREISDKISLLFANRHDPVHTESTWTLEILLICANARLFRGDFGSSAHETDVFPGYSLFNHVCERIPSLSRLHSFGRSGVEVLALVAVYLVNINRKEEAYIYISTALRLAISHGFHRKSPKSRLLQSEVSHINRLWWSVYLQERRLAAATGHPSGISDAVIEQDLPSDCIGSTPATPMRTSIKLARVYGLIITGITTLDMHELASRQLTIFGVLYGSVLQEEAVFVSKVQEIVKSLYNISDEIPVELATGFPMLGQDVSMRTSGALHLIFYHALLLTIRPIMLHMAQLILNGKAPQPETLYLSPLGKLCKTCTEAARRLLEVLMTLRQHKFITLFGFFDLDGMSSVAFIMILTEVLDSACADDLKINPSPGLGEALDLMEHVASYGNKFAQQSLEDIRKTWIQLCSRLNIDRPIRCAAPSPLFDDGMSGDTGTTKRADPIDPLMFPQTQNYRRDSPPQDPSMSDIGSCSLGAVPHGTQSILADLDIREHMSHLWAPLLEDEMDLQNEDGGTNAHNFYQNLYGNPQWQFTGEGMGDFAEFGRHIVNWDHAS
ncbi:fungal specific transcription factor domain-containing protein [Purpureocillium lavendulum]|uniref:Fungal specific transcription factor domain-containing protein n=1 Tax=Purpureocillium lavendulum TaxID=1247861 RepID=A0AB34G424_9HYPO|nr:fungal specific transcription factor domain-containing protein [Purpureocillium lavendulum]